MSGSADGMPQTGDPRVDDALRGVGDLAQVPVDEHAERLSAAHAALQEVLQRPTDRAAAPASPLTPGS